jgi:hypothetical protein
MAQRLTYFFASTALTAMLALPASAQEYSNGGNCKKGRKEATMTPVEAFGVHPPGPDPADQKRCIFCWWRKIFTPYYAPLSPTSTSVRWKPWCYFPLLPYYTPYYIGYCPKRCCNPKPAPYGSDQWGEGPMPDHPLPLQVGVTPLGFGPYTSVITDDTVFWNMGGNGLVPYGTPRPPHYGTPDLVDAIQAARALGGGDCVLPPGGPPVAAPAVLPPAEKPGDEQKTAPPNDQDNGTAPGGEGAAPPQ